MSNEHLIQQAKTSGQLNLAHLQLTTLPPQVFDLIHLTSLYLDNNQLNTLSPKIARLTHLRVLSLTHNALTTLPPEIAHLKNLEWLYLDRNQFQFLPPELAKLRNLKVLSLTHNQLVEIPAALVELPYLTVLSVEHNPLLFPPSEIVVQGTRALLTYLRGTLQIRKQWTAKLLVMGEMGVGKTALVRKLRKEPFQVYQEPTQGIAVSSWSVESATKVTLPMNIWDFGGKAVYQAVHQFFLTNRALYMLVWNAKLGYERGRLYYWLDVIQAKAPDSPILLVATHLDEAEVVLPLTDLKRKYPSIIDNYQVSNKTGEGLDNLQQALTTQANQLPTTPWPLRWLTAANGLRARPERYLTVSHLQDFFKSKGLSEEEGQVLAKWLQATHELLEFPSNDKALVLLQPHWVMDYLSRVLTSPLVTANKGIFSQAHREEIWGDLDIQTQEHLLNLMESLNLAYHTLENKDTSLVVECLPLDPPPHYKHWEFMKNTKEVRMIFKFNVLPPGIPTWLIARFHQFSTNTHWRYGALLAHDRHLGLIQVFPKERKLTLAVRGTYPHNFFALLREGLELLLQRYPGLKIKRKVPCHHPSCSYEFDYTLLERAWSKGVREVQCQETFENLAVEALLFGLDWRTQVEVLEKIAEAKTHPDKGNGGNSWCELAQRHLFQELKSSPWFLELQHPYVFILESPGVNNWLHKLFAAEHQITLQLYCQGTLSEAPHPTELGGRYPIHDLKKWVTLLPTLILIHLVTMIGITDNLLQEELQLLKKLRQKLPHFDSSSLGLLLKELDPLEQWGGLKKVVTCEGRVVWLCSHHASEYKRSQC